METRIQTKIMINSITNEIKAVIVFLYRFNCDKDTIFNKYTSGHKPKNLLN